MVSLASAFLLLAIRVAPVEITLDVNGVKRVAMIYPSTKEAPKDGAPLVFAFHGHGGNMRNSARSFQMHELWPEAVVVYPQGLPTTGMTDPEGKRPGWQQRPDDNGGRDFKFFDVLFEKVKSDYKIDASHVYAMGHSNGGRFTYLLWAMRPDVFAAFAPSASPGFGLVGRMKPKPAFILAGEEDQLVSFASQRLTIEAIKKLLVCPADPSSKEGYLSLFKGKEGIELATYVTPGDHTYVREANPKIVEFFKRQKRA